nr:outer membrane beta-barrel protein [Francisella sp. SYW-9]
MKSIINTMVVGSMLCASVTMSFATSSDSKINFLSNKSDIYSNVLIKPFKVTYDSITNKDNSWGSQDRSGQWYLGIDANGIAIGGNYGSNAKGGSSGWNGILGYSINKYLAVQYNQFATYNGMFGGLGEGVINLSNHTMLTPYAAGGAGWANLAGDATGAWDVGGGLKFELSKHLQASVDYRYIQTMAPSDIVGHNARAGINMIGAGLTWFFNKNN